MEDGKKILSCGYGCRVVYDVASSLKAKVSSVLKEKSYVWKPLRSNSLVSIQRKLPLVDIGDIESVKVGRVWLELPNPIHSYKPNTSSIRKPSTSRIVTLCNSRPMTYIYIYIYILGL